MSPPASRYSEQVLTAFSRLPHAGPLAEGAGTTMAGEAIALDRGAWVRFDARIERGQFADCRFRAWGCPHVLAAAARTAQTLTGAAVATATITEAHALLMTLGAPAEKLGRMLVVEDAARELLAAARAVQSS